MTSVIAKSDEARVASLRYIADRILSVKFFSRQSAEFYSACALNESGQAYGIEVFNRTDISNTNKILLGLTFPKSLQDLLTEFVRSAFKSPQETSNLIEAGIDIRSLSNTLGVPLPSFTVEDFEKLDKKKFSVFTIARFVDWSAVEHSKLVKLVADSKKAGFFMPRDVQVELAKQDKYLIDIAQEDGIYHEEVMLAAVRSTDQSAIDQAYDLFQFYLKDKNRNHSKVMEIAVELMRAGKGRSLLDQVATYFPFEVYTGFELFAKTYKVDAIAFLRSKLASGDLSPLQVVGIAINSGLAEQFTEKF
jgi:hypothetical protein